MTQGEPAGSRQPLNRPRRRVDTEELENNSLMSGRIGGRRPQPEEEATPEGRRSFPSLRASESESPAAERRRVADPGSLRSPVRPESKRRLRMRKIKKAVRQGALGIACFVGLGALGAAGLKHWRPKPVAAPPLAAAPSDEGVAIQSPSEWLPALTCWGVFGKTAPPRIDPAQEKALLIVENYCARFGEYPEQSHFADGWVYTKSGLEMSLQGPGGSYDSLLGWSGGAGPQEAGTGTVASSAERLHLAWNRSQLEDWLNSNCGLALNLPKGLEKVSLDYQVAQHQGTLRFSGVTLPKGEDKFPEELWNHLPLSSQRAVFRPGLIEAILGPEFLQPNGNFWSPFLLARRDEWVGFGINAPVALEADGPLTELRGELSLLANGKLPGFILQTNDGGSLVESNKLQGLEVSAPASGLSLLALGATPPAPAKAAASAKPDKAEPHSGMVAAGSTLLGFSASERVVVDWQARPEKNGLAITFTTRELAAPRKVAEAPTSGPDLEKQHHTHTSVVAGR